MTTPPLTERYREAPFWWDGVSFPVPADRERPARRADVVVVGAGYTGLGAALELAQRGRSVVVLEGEHLGYGASTRNGGMIHPGLKLEVDALLARYGPLGRRLYDFTVDAFDAAERVIDDEGIDCGYRRSGHLYLAHRASHVASLRDLERLYRDDLGQEARFVPREELPSEIGSRAYHAGVVVAKSGGLHPARYFAGLARLALRAGAEIHDRTPAVRISRRRPAGFEVATPGGVVSAGEVVVATNGYTGTLVPWLHRRIVPIGSYIIATEPLDPQVAADVSPRGRMFFDSKNFLFYWRVYQGRMLFGGRASMAPTTVARTRDILYRAMLSVHPQLAGVRVDRAWGGSVGFTFDRMPHAGRAGGVVYAMGYCGTGLALSWHLGRRIAAWIEGEDPPPFVGLRFPVPPAGAASRRLLPVAGMYYQLRDRIG